jgi:hypothetical protein
VSSSFCGAGGDGPVVGLRGRLGLVFRLRLRLAELRPGHGGRSPSAAARLGGGLRGADDRGGDAVDRLVAESRRGQQLLRAFLCAADDRAGLVSRPFERLLDLRACRVGELGRLVARLLEQPRRARLGLGDLLGGLLPRLLGRLARLGLGGVKQLGALALALLAVTVDLARALLQLALTARDLLLGASQLRGRGRLRVALDRVGHLGGGADHVHRVHPHGVAGRLDTALPGGLEDAELHLQLRGVAAESLEGLAHLLAVEAVGGARQVLDPRQRRQRRCLRRSLGTFGCQMLLLTRPRTVSV